MASTSTNFIQQMSTNLTDQQRERWMKSREEALRKKAEAEQRKREQMQSQQIIRNGLHF
jgi:hypothetical protein